jgi:F-type H+-transporting ATPase subunit b
MNLLRSLVIVLMSAAPAAAAEEHAAPISHIIYPLLNFLIFLYLLRRFAVPLARAYFRSRREELARTVNEAAAAREAAAVRLNEYKDRWAALQAEIKKIHETYIAEGETEKTKLLEEGRMLAAKIKADADFVAVQEGKVAQRKLRQAIARAAHDAAAATIRTHLTADDHKRLVDEFVTGLGGQQ